MEYVALGTVLARKYRIERLLGEGGMATVYAARHLSLDEVVAIKVVHRRLMATEGAVERFQREARTASKVRGPHSVTIHDVDTLESGEPFLVMELLTGEDLGRRLDRVGRLPYREASAIVLQACEALRTAHDAEIIHRDIKPANLFLCERPGDAPLVKVVDFGIARWHAGGSQPLTGGGAFLGSPLYMAPEQMADPRSVDGRADIWSLGCTLYHATTGSPPFPGDSWPVVCAAAMEKTPTRPASIDASIAAGFSDVVMTCIEKDPAKRYASIAALAAALAPFAEPASASLGTANTMAAPIVLPDAAPAQAPPPARRRALRIGVLGGFLGVLIAGAAIGWFLLFGRDTPTGKARRPTARSAQIAREREASAQAQLVVSAPRQPTPPEPVLPLDIDWSQRALPEFDSIEDMAEHARKGGLEVNQTNVDREVEYTRMSLTLRRLPCIGAAIYFRFRTLELAVSSVPRYQRVFAGARVLRAERRVLVVHAYKDASGIIDSPCSDKLALVMTR